MNHSLIELKQSTLKRTTNVSRTSLDPPPGRGTQVNGYTIQLSVTQRLANGWKEIHDEMNWRGGHADSCDFHRCPVQNCTCYHKFPGFLLRRVNTTGSR